MSPLLIHRSFSLLSLADTSSSEITQPPPIYRDSEMKPPPVISQQQPAYPGGLGNSMTSKTPPALTRPRRRPRGRTTSGSRSTRARASASLSARAASRASLRACVGAACVSADDGGRRRRHLVRCTGRQRYCLARDAGVRVKTYTYWSSSMVRFARASSGVPGSGLLFS